MIFLSASSCFSHELPNAHIPRAQSILELIEGVLFNTRVEILVFWYFHLVANSRRFSSARMSILRAYICKASTHMALYTLHANNTKDKVGISIQLYGSATMRLVSVIKELNIIRFTILRHYYTVTRNRKLYIDEKKRECIMIIKNTYIFYYIWYPIHL